MATGTTESGESQGPRRSPVDAAVFAIILENLTLPLEGGYYDGSGSHDPNPTLHGITQRRYDSYRRSALLEPRPVLEMEEDEQQDIYRTYWIAAHCPELLGETDSVALAATVFDHAVNAGPYSAVKVLQRAVGTDDDGDWGRESRAALKQAWRTRKILVPAKVTNERLRFYLSLADAKANLRPNLRSWNRRIIRFFDLYY